MKNELPLWKIPVYGLAVFGAWMLFLEVKSALTFCSGDSKRMTAEAHLRQLGCALEEYALLKNGRYPEELFDLCEPDERGLTFLGRKSLPLDPWKQEYYYATLDDRSDYVLFSLGRNRQYGGSDSQDGDVLFSSIGTSNEGALGKN